MPTILGRDVAERYAARFSGRLQACSFIKSTTTGQPSLDDPSGAPPTSETTYTCDGIAFAYTDSFIKGETIKKNAYLVTITIGSIKACAKLALAGAHIDSLLEALDGGALGNSITIELIDDASDPAGELEEGETSVVLHFQSGASTTLDMEALLAGSTLVRVKEASATPSAVLDGGDVLAATPLVGGSDAPGVIPNPGDSIRIPPPNQATAADGIVFDVPTITHAAVTVAVDGGGF